jgi:hypothetical protein
MSRPLEAAPFGLSSLAAPRVITRNVHANDHHRASDLVLGLTARDGLVADGDPASRGLRNLELNDAPTPQTYTVVPSIPESFHRGIARKPLNTAPLHRPSAWHALCGPRLTNRVDIC